MTEKNIDFINKKVKIIKDTVSHRIPINKIVKIKSLAEIRKGKKCYNVLDICCYISEDDFILVEQDTLNEYITKDDNLYNKYAKIVDNDKNKVKVNNFVYAKNVMSLDPSGRHKEASSGKYILTGKDNLRYWLRSLDNKDLNEYYCLFEDAKKL
jgi:hypothetical protein